MDVLSTRIHEWVAQQKTQAAAVPGMESLPTSGSNQN